MKKRITTVTLGILMMASAIAMYGGECKDIDLSSLNLSEDILYIVIGNSSNINGSHVTVNNITKNATICFEPNYKPDSFTIVFFNNVTNEVIKEVNIGSSHSRTKYVDRIEIQNQTVYIPEYIDKEVEVEKIKEVIIDNIIDVENRFETWHIIFAMICGGLFIWIVMKKKND